MATQNAQRAHKVEVVDEVKTRLTASAASIVSEYRGLTVAELADLRTALEAVGGDYKIFKNTLVRRAVDGNDYQPLSEYLTGPTALTFVQGDISAVAKALRDFSRANPLLVIKGGLADGSLLSTSELAALADLPPREVLLARLAGALAAPMTQMAGLLKALPQNLAYGISALIDQRVEGGEVLPPAEDAPPRPTRPQLRRPRRLRPKRLRPKRLRPKRLRMRPLRRTRRSRPRQGHPPPRWTKRRRQRRRKPRRRRRPRRTLSRWQR